LPFIRDGGCADWLSDDSGELLFFKLVTEDKEDEEVEDADDEADGVLEDDEDEELDAGAELFEDDDAFVGVDEDDELVELLLLLLLVGLLVLFAALLLFDELELRFVWYDWLKTCWKLDVTSFCCCFLYDSSRTGFNKLVTVNALLYLGLKAIAALAK